MQLSRGLGVTVLLTFLLLTGCAFYYFDEETNSQHLIGIGHMVTRVHGQDNSAVAMYGVTTVGVGVGEIGQSSAVSVGFQSRRELTLVKEGSLVKLCWPSGQFLSFPVVVLREIPESSNLSSEFLTTCYE